MKKIFTTLAAAAMVAMSANAAITVTYEGKPVENGGEIVVTNDDFTYVARPEYNYYQYSCEVIPTIESGTPATLKSVASDMTVQTCPGGTCVPSMQEGNDWVVTKVIDQTDWTCDIHFVVNAQHLSDATQWIKVTITDDDDEPFNFTVTCKMTDSSAVEGIAAAEANVAAIYDMQGRRVNSDFRGAAIVVYDNGKAIKTILK